MRRPFMQLPLESARLYQRELVRSLQPARATQVRAVGRGRPVDTAFLLVLAPPPFEMCMKCAFLRGSRHFVQLTCSNAQKPQLRILPDRHHPHDGRTDHPSLVSIRCMCSSRDAPFLCCTTVRRSSHTLMFGRQPLADRDKTDHTVGQGKAKPSQNRVKSALSTSSEVEVSRVCTAQ